jgi:hypothetical protein
MSLCLLCVALASHAQKLYITDSVVIDFPTAASVDRTGNVFISNTRGEVRKYSSFGKLLATFTPQQPAAVSSLEAWQMLRVFVFYGQSQQYIFLDRFLNASQPQLLSNLTSGFAPHATTGEDNSLWLINETSLTLEKYDLRTSRQLINTDLSLFLDNDFQFFGLKIYQNKVYISMGKQGVLVFDAFGSFIQKLPLDNITRFNFYDDELYYLNENYIHFYNLYTFQERFIELPAKTEPLYGLVVLDKVILITERMMYLYRFVP